MRFGDGEIERLQGRAWQANIEATRAEAGCERYTYAVDIADPNLLQIARGMERRGGDRRPYAAPHMPELMGALGSAKIEAISINAYEAHFLKTIIGGSERLPVTPPFLVIPAKAGIQLLPAAPALKEGEFPLSRE